MLGDTPTQMRIIKKTPEQVQKKTLDRNFTPEEMSSSNRPNLDHSFNKVPESPTYYGVQFLGSIPTSENFELTPNAKNRVLKQAMASA